MANPSGGGYVLTMKSHKHLVGRRLIDNETLLKVVKALDIQSVAPNVKDEKDVSDIETINIYRGPAPT
jgi:hypothetical protein